MVDAPSCRVDCSQFDDDMALLDREVLRLKSMAKAEGPSNGINGHVCEQGNPSS